MLRVLEIGGHAAGYCGRLYAHAGAEVVRLELPLPFNQPIGPGWVSEQANNLYLHSGKRRLQITDLDLLAQFANAADVVVLEAATADTALDLGFDNWHTPLRISITPFGLTGPKRNWQATPNVLLAMGGYTKIMGDAQRMPLTLPGHYVEFQSAQYAYTAATACELAGESNRVDVSMLETVLSLSQYTTMMWHCNEQIRERHGSDFWSICPINFYPCRDGWIYINVIPSFWEAFTNYLQQPLLEFDPRFATNDDRLANREALTEIICEYTSSLTVAEAEALAEQCRVPAAYIRSFSEVLGDPHLADRNFWQQVESDGLKVKLPPVPARQLSGANRRGVFSSATIRQLTKVESEPDLPATGPWS